LSTLFFHQPYDSFLLDFIHNPAAGIESRGARGSGNEDNEKIFPGQCFPEAVMDLDVVDRVPVTSKLTYSPKTGGGIFHDRFEDGMGQGGLDLARQFDTARVDDHRAGRGIFPPGERFQDPGERNRLFANLRFHVACLQFAVTGGLRKLRIILT
jgi:hypothetical protein